MLTFFALAFVMTVGAIGVITLRQPVHAALSLVGTLLTLAVTYVTLQAHFLAAIQVIVYAGAIMVLFLFVIMLLNVQGEGKPEQFRWMRPAAFAVGLIAVGAISYSAFRSPDLLPDAAIVSAALQGGGAASIGESLFGEFLLAFHLVGVLLLTGIVGAVGLVQRRAETVQGPPSQVAVRRGVGAPGRGDGAVATLERDDLTRMRGVGPKLAALLNRYGVHSFSHLAALTPSEARALERKVAHQRGAALPEDWLEQARRLSQENS